MVKANTDQQAFQSLAQDSATYSVLPRKNHGINFVWKTVKLLESCCFHIDQE